MKNNLIKILVLMLCVVLSLALVACKKPVVEDPLDARIVKTPPAIVYPTYSGGDTLVVGYNDFSSKFSPFFAKTAYDQDASAMTQVSLLTTDRMGNIINNAIEGETISYMGTDYTYTGIANFDVVVGATTTVYTITIRDDLFFSDGMHLTIDDVIFSMYALCDPSYYGSSTLYSKPIQGMELFRTNGIDKSAEAATFMDTLASASTKMAADTDLTAAEQAAFEWAMDYIQDTSAWASWAFNYTIAQYKSWGYGEEADSDATVYYNVAVDEFLYYYDDYAPELETFKAVQLASAEALEKGTVVKEISGIKKTGSYSMTVTTDGFDATTIYSLGIEVAPLHYYGNVAKYKYTESKFGFDKGDLSTIQAKTTQPMGAGAYKFVEFKNGVIYYVRNGYYYKGCPKITNIQFKETTDADKVSGIIAGTFDVTDPSFNNSAITLIKGANSNTELTGNVVSTSAVDNLGYGYIGINAKNVKVGTDPGSAASKSLRKAFATVFSVYRDIVIDSYYGDRASVINYPISNTSWAAPQATDDGYEIAFSVDAEGNPLYTASMTAQQRYDAALVAVKAYLVAAGYTWDAGTSKFTAAPTGASLTYTVIIPADGIGDHPAFGILTYAVAALDTLGITLIINDPANSNVLWTALEAGSAEMWCAAWGATIDPDMYQVYHSSNAVGLGGTDSNHYAINDATLDEKIMAARTSADKAYRKALYKDCLDIVLDWAVEVPTYQRQNAIIFSTARVKMGTVTPDITTFWGWMHDIEGLELA